MSTLNQTSINDAVQYTVANNSTVIGVTVATVLALNAATKGSVVYSVGMILEAGMAGATANKNTITGIIIAASTVPSTLNSLSSAITLIRGRADNSSPIYNNTINGAFTIPANWGLFFLTSVVNAVAVDALGAISYAVIA